MSVVQCLFVAFATALLLHSANCQEKPSITYVSQEQIQDLGSSAELECKVQNSQDYPVVWIKLGRTDNESMIISTNNALVIRDHRYSLRNNATTSTFTLRINDIQKTDEGLYQCLIVISPDTKMTAGVELKLRIPPIFSENLTKWLVVSEGQSAKFQCYAEGYPKPEISWRRENNAKLPNGNSIFYGNELKINEVQKEHRGAYYCMAKNGVGDPGSRARHTVILEVEFAPIIEVKQPRVGQALQYDVNLVCHIIAYPPPAITWHKDQEQLVNNQHYHILNFFTDDEYYSTLRVIGIEKTQFGDYVCRAANKLGAAKTKVHLFESETPVCPPACGQASNSHNTGSKK